jgi:hypothetical protein
MSETARWLLLIVSLPGAATSRSRVATWRKLKRSGALALKDSVYILPATDDATEMANWLAHEVRSVGGEASIANTTSISGLEDAALVDQFNALRDSDYAQIEESLGPLVKAAAKRDDGARSALKAEVRRARQRLGDLARIDFFRARGGARVRELCERARTLLEDGTTAPLDERRVDRADYQGRLWATRARPKIDRLASAWLIRHFIDPASRFGFFAERDGAPRDAVTFDTYGGTFTHEGEDCTFEVLVRRFGIDDPALRPLAEVIHDADLKDDKFGRLEHVGLDAIIRGLVETIPDDQALAIAAFPIFAALRASLASSPEPERPSPTKARRGKAGRPTRKAK